jgi:hypothetical protein
VALGTFIAGRYSATYDPPGAVAAADVGITERGYDLSISFLKERIAPTDAYGDTVVDNIYRGANVRLSAIFDEYKAGSLNNSDAVNSVFAPSGATFFGLGLIGRLDSNVAGILILTDTDSTPAATFPATLTATYSIIAENYDIRLLFAPSLRKVPVQLQILPYLDTSIKFFTTT